MFSIERTPAIHLDIFVVKNVLRNTKMNFDLFIQEYF